MIQHIVMLSPSDGYDKGEMADVMQGLSALQIAGFTGFTHGPNRDLENKTPDHPYGFICTFTDVAALQTYANDVDHQALGARLVALCGGGDGIMVIDLEVPDV
jgi:hypothetical protein